MATRTESGTLPYGIGHFNLGWVLVIVALLAILGVGAYAYSRQLIEGEIVTGLRDVGAMGGAPWGLYIAFELYAVGIGFGAMILLGAIRLLGLEHLRPLSRTLGLITLTTLVAGYLAVMADVGQPLRAMVNIARYARPMSPFFGTFTVGLVTSVIATWVYLYLGSRRDASLLSEKATGWRLWLRFIAAGYHRTSGEEKRRQVTSMVLGIVVLALGITAASSSGFVFSMQIARPGWYGALQAPGFVVLAGVTATGVLIIVAAILRSALKEKDRLNMQVFRWLNNILLGLTLTYVYFLLAELITVGYGGSGQETRLSDSLLKGEFVWFFWASGGLFLLSFLIGVIQPVLRWYSIKLIVTVAILVNVAGMLKRFIIVVPSLTYGNLLPYPVGSYSPTWVEYAVVVGLGAFGILMYILFMKVFPIMEVREES